MTKNYLKIAWRNLLRNKLFSVINIGGLALGIAACLLISLYVHHQSSYDSFNTKKDRIVRVTNMMHTPEKDNVNIALTPTLLASTVRNYPEVETAVRFQPLHATVKVNNQLFKEDNFCQADVNVFDVFSFKFLEGSPAQALTDPNTIVLTQKAARKYFGSGHALGQTLICNKVACRVSAVLEDMPDNSEIKIDALRPNDFYKTTSWLADDFSVYTFVLFKQQPDLKSFNAKLAAISKKDVQPELNKAGAVHYSIDFNTELLPDVHFSEGKLGDTPKGDKTLVYIFSVLSVVILLVALLNYINLSTARAAERAKEVGIRKVNGALQGSLIRQFLFESFFVTLLALLIGLGLTAAALPFLNSLLDIKVTVSQSFGSLLLVCGLVLASSLLTGLYPAFVLSGFSPVDALKANFKHQSKGISLRKVITVTQFVIATVMIAGAFIMNRQINFVEHRSLGYNRSQVLNISLPDDSVALLQVPSFKNALRGLSVVKGASVQTGLAIDNGGQAKATTLVKSEGRKRELMSNYFSVDDKFIPMLNMKLLAGRNFSEQITSDKKEGFIVNEAFVRQVGWKKPIGEAIEGFEHKGHVVGVVNDFHYTNMHSPIAPLVMVYSSMKPLSVLVKVNPADLEKVRAEWLKFFPEFPFDYQFMDDAFNAAYHKDVTTIRLFNYFTVLSIVLACLGLYGLAYLIVSQRTREIGIRKVLGAAFENLLVLLSKGFVKLIAIAALLAIPITLLIMNKWLNTYAYHIHIEWWLMLIPIALILLISISVISYQVIRVALTKPVKSLRSE